jgi:hypothetical protein
MINNCHNNIAQHYKPVKKQTYHTRLKQLLKEELNIYGKPKVLDLLAEEIENLNEENYPKNEYMRLGQIRVVVPSLRDKPSFGQKIEDTELITVTLDILTSEDIERYIKGEGHVKIQQERLARIANQAKLQGGLLSQPMAGLLLGIKQSCVSRYAIGYRKRTGKVIPLRGLVHDIGRSTTHKEWIINLYQRGYTEAEISWITGHAIQSIGKYLKRYKQIEVLIEEIGKVPAIDKASRLLNMSNWSAREYLTLYRRYHNVIKQRNKFFIRTTRERYSCKQEGPVHIGKVIDNVMRELR